MHEPDEDETNYSDSSFWIGGNTSWFKMIFLNKKRHDICIFNVSEKDFKTIGLNIFFLNVLHTVSYRTLSIVNLDHVTITYKTTQKLRNILIIVR